MRKYFILLVIMFAGAPILFAQKTKNYTVSAFTNLEINGAYSVKLTQGANYALKIEADEEDFEFIEVSKNGNKLIIKFKENEHISINNEIEIWISSPVLEEIEINGAVDLECENTWNLSAINIEVNGASSMEWDVNCQDFTMDLSGASKVDLSGNAQKASVSISGAGALDAKDFITKKFEIDLSGAGNAKVYANESLSANISGIGIVTYYGNPTNIHSDISLLGVLENGE